jgi:integrase
MPLDAIKVATVEDYIANKQSESDPLSPRSIKMTVTLLGAILDDALDSEIIEGRNPARGRKIADRKQRRSSLDTAPQITALLEAAGELDAEAAKSRRHVERRAIIATLVFSGLRIGELCGLRWRDVDLASGWLTVRESKTEAGSRKVKMGAALRDELASVRARRQDASAESFVFSTRANGQQDTHNVRARVVNAAVKRANSNLLAADLPPLPERLTPHSLRRTFCSIQYALGEQPDTVMDEMGHTDPALALRVYKEARQMRRDEGEVTALRALADGAQLAVIGIPADVERVEDGLADAA